MTLFNVRPFILLVALLVLGSATKLDGTDTVRELDLIMYANARDTLVYERSESVGIRRVMRKGAHSPREEDDCNLHPEGHLCSDISVSSELSKFSSSVSFSVSSSVSSSISSAISSSVSSYDASVLTSALVAARQTAWREGFQYGQSRASKALDSAVTATAGASMTMESMFAVVQKTSSAVEANGSATNHQMQMPQGLMINGGQLAGVIIGVFLMSSIFSVLTTLFLLWYRGRKTANKHNSHHWPGEKKSEQRWPRWEKLRNTICPLQMARERTRARRDLLRISSNALEEGRPSQSPSGLPFSNRSRNLTTPVTPHSNLAHRECPAPRLADLPPQSHGADVLGLGGHRPRDSPRHYETREAPTTGYPRAREASRPEVPQIEITLPSPFVTATFPTLKRSVAFADLHDDPEPRRAPRRRTRRMSAFEPMTARRSTVTPPTIPTRFSSLNSHPFQPFIQHRTQDPIPPPVQPNPVLDPSANHGTFYIAADEESAEYDPGFSQNHSNLQSPTPSHSSTVQLDAIHPTTGSAEQQLPSRFSMSSGPLSSLGHTGSSSSTGSQYIVQQPLEEPEIYPLRPPPNHSQLVAPRPTRPHTVAFMEPEPSIHEDS
ncbi:hypothetical protein F4808DRAFT_51266 [Astrocystis sublimbata]|nr:hypothetical protein F4808DRAFT_51266 [Astrocystis sublimbata]